MIQRVFAPQDIPLADLEKIGLVKDGQFLIAGRDLEAMMAGRRTDMLNLRNLSADGIKIDTIDAKLSLRYNRGGKAELLLHPVYKEAVYPEYLTDVEAEKLQKGTAVNIEKVIIKDGKKVDALIEYDPDTKEFIITDTAKVMAPDLINNEYLSPEQKQRFKKGKEVEISDGTAFQYTANDVQGVRSNKLALVASLIIDGGITYMLYAGLKAMNNKLRDETLAGQYSAGYNDAIAELFKNQEKSDFWKQSDIADDKRQMKR
jgi:hypothetical protein